MGSAKQQGDGWGARARDFAEANEPAWTEVFIKVLDRTGVQGGTALLDIGCGAGGALVLAGQRGAVVSGLDASAALTAIARERLPGADIRTGEMEELPFGDRTFDVVTGINSFQFAETPARALAEAGRACRKGGRIAMMAWGRPEQCQLLSMVMPAVFALSPAPAPGARPMLRLSDSGAAEQLYAEAGLALESLAEFDGALEFADHDAAVRSVLSASARAIGHSGETRVRDAVSEALLPAVQSNGKVRLDNVFVLASARG